MGFSEPPLIGGASRCPGGAVLPVSAPHASTGTHPYRGPSGQFHSLGCWRYWHTGADTGHPSGAGPGEKIFPDVWHILPAEDLSHHQIQLPQRDRQLIPQSSLCGLDILLRVCFGSLGLPGTNKRTQQLQFLADGVDWPGFKYCFFLHPKHRILSSPLPIYHFSAVQGVPIEALIIAAAFLPPFFRSSSQIIVLSDIEIVFKASIQCFIYSSFLQIETIK